MQHTVDSIHSVMGEEELVRRIVSRDERAWQEFLDGPYGALLQKAAGSYALSIQGWDVLWESDDLLLEAIALLMQPNCRPCLRKPLCHTRICPGCQRDWWVLRRWSSLPAPHCSLATWLTMAIKNHFTSLYRRTNRRPANVSLSEEWVEYLCHQDLTPWLQEEQLDIYAILSALSKDERQILLLHVLQGLTTMEIAAELKISFSAANSRLYRAKRHLHSHQI